MAEPRVQNFLSALRTRGTVPSLRAGIVPVEQSPARLRLVAEARFRDALGADSGLVEARVRLGYLLGLRSEHEEAAAELRRAIESQLPPLFEYYAWLLLGRSEHAQERSAEAR